MFQKNTLIAEILEKAPGAAPMFQAIGMHCFGCALAHGETLEEACAVHGVDADVFLEELNAFAASAKNAQA